MGGETTERAGRVRREAFTLVELLVVVAVIVMLMALLLPALGAAREQGREVACQANLRQCGVYFCVYTEENDHRFFSGLQVGTGMPGWCKPMEGYFADEPDVLLCPSARRYRRLDGVSPDWGGGSRSAWKYGGTISSYGSNHWITAVTAPFRRTEWLAQCWETPLVKEASSVPVFPGCMFGGGGPTAEDGPPVADDVHRVTGGGCNMAHFCVNRHRGHVNGLFMDWSVRKVGLKELWTLKWHRTYETSGPWTKAGGVLPGDWPVWMREFRNY